MRQLMYLTQMEWDVRLFYSLTSPHFITDVVAFMKMGVRVGGYEKETKRGRV